MSGLVCLKDGKFLRTEKIGVFIEEGMPTGLCACGATKDKHPVPSPVIPGRIRCAAFREQWTGYKLWVGDIYQCPACGFQLVSGFPRQPVSEHFQSDYAEKVAKHRPLVRVNDPGGVRP